MVASNYWAEDEEKALLLPKRPYRMPMSLSQCVGYEIGSMMRFALYAILGQITYAILSWVGLFNIPTIALFTIYLGTTLGCFYSDWIVFKDEEFHSAAVHTLRTMVDMVLFILFCDLLLTENPLDSETALNNAKKMIESFGSYLSLDIFLVGLYLANLAFLSCARAIVNMGISGYLGFFAFLDEWNNVGMVINEPTLRPLEDLPVFDSD